MAFQIKYHSMNKTKALQVGNCRWKEEQGMYLNTYLRDMVKSNILM